MSSAIITVIGFNECLETQNKSLFDKLILPAGIDKEILTDNILLKASEFEVIYSNPDFMANAIGLWSKKHFKTFEKWQKALELEFNPIENYDRIEEWTDNNTGTVTDDGSSSANGTSSDTLSNVNTETVSAFDSDTYEPSKETNSSSTNTMSNTNSGQSKNTRTDDLTSNHKGRIHGNIGVTTSSALLSEYLDIATWNIYEHITDLFIQEFCILIY